MIFYKNNVIIYIENEKRDITTNASLFKKKKVTSAVDGGVTGVVKLLSKKTKPPFAEERNINTENFSWWLERKNFHNTKPLQQLLKDFSVKKVS